MPDYTRSYGVIHEAIEVQPGWYWPLRSRLGITRAQAVRRLVRARNKDMQKAQRKLDSMREEIR